MTSREIPLWALAFAVAILGSLAGRAHAETLILTQAHGYQRPADADVVRVLRTGGSVWAAVDTVQPTERITVCIDDPAVAIGSTTTCTTRIPGRTDNWQLKSLAIPPPPPKLGTVTYQWDTPTENSDGSPLTDLAGYELYVRLQDCEGTPGCAPPSYESALHLGLVNTFTVPGVTLKACAKIQARNKAGDVGAITDEFCKPAQFPKIVPGPVPNFR